MKKSFTFLIAVLFSVCVYAQAPQKMSYQAVIRDASGNLITSHAVGLRLSILQGSATGTIVYAETQISTTNTNGLLSIELGGGNIVSGTFASINWANGPYFIKTETDPTGGTNYSITGTSQLLSVPYALHAKTSENGFSGNYNDLTNKPTTDGSETKVQAGTNITVTGTGTNTNPYIVNSTSSSSGVSGTIIGDLQYWNGTTWVILHPGTTGQVLTLNSSNIPVWQTNTGGSSANVPQLTTIAEKCSLNVACNLYTDLNYWNNGTSFYCNFGGNITSDGGNSIISRGICWSTSANPTIANNKTIDGIGIGSFCCNALGLLGNSTYYLRAYATNILGTGYGQTIQFTTSAPAFPGINTSPLLDITETSAKCGGEITSYGGANIIYRGVCWNTSQYPTINNYKTIDSSGNNSFINNLTNLNSGTTYYVRAYATNSVGTSYGSQTSFTTLITLPILTTTNVSLITSSSATSGGNISNNGLTSILNRGVCWSTSPYPTIANTKTIDGSGTGSFISNMTGLLANTIYYIRAYATNSNGTAYGNEVIFTTSNPLPINYTNIYLGFPNNSIYGSSFSSINGIVYTLANAKINSAKIDFILYWTSSNSASISAPADLSILNMYFTTSNSPSTWSVVNNTKLLKTNSFNFTTCTSNDINSLSPTNIRVENLAVGDIIAFQTASTNINFPNKKGVAKIITIQGSGNSAFITLDLKIAN